MNLDCWVQRLMGRATCLIEREAKLSSSARIRNALGQSKKIVIGDHSIVQGELLLFAHGGEIQIGKWCFIGESARIWSSKKISIGDRVLVSHGVNIFDSLTHPLSASKRHEQFKEIVTNGHPSEIDLGEREVSIEDDVWLGANSMILRGVTLGKGCVVGAGAVVTKDVPAYTVVAGNPASMIRVLPDHER